MHARASIERQADKKKAPPVPLPSRAFSHTRGHLRVSRASLDGLRKKETARSLLLQSKTWVPLWYRDFSYSSFDSFTKTQQICKLHFLAFFPLAGTAEGEGLVGLQPYHFYRWDLFHRIPVDMEKISVEFLDFAVWNSGMFACQNDYNPMCVQG